MTPAPPKPGILMKDWRDWAERLCQWLEETVSRSPGMVVIPKYLEDRLPKAVGYGMILVQGEEAVYPAYSDGSTWRKFSDDTEVGAP